MNRSIKIFICVTLMMLVYKVATSQIILVENKQSTYSILIPEHPSRVEVKAAEVLQDYISRVSDFKLNIIKETKDSKWRLKDKILSVGNTGLAKEYSLDLPSEAFSIQQKGEVLFFQGTGKGILYAAYDFVEEVLGCRKWYANEPAFCPEKSKVIVPHTYSRREQPAFSYREVYSLVESDEEYVDWHRIHLLSDLWGMWGHSFDVLVPPGNYFKAHPEYFSLVDGRRQVDQLCLSNPVVLEIAAKAVGQAIKDHPDATFWSVSPNDNSRYCECEFCSKINDAEGGPQGSLIHFVNKIAARFPDKHFTTLAYTYTARPTRIIKPAKNVTMFLSNIDADRTQSIVTEPSAATFRSQLQGWRQKTDHIFIWDYYTQFTNYLSPFPLLGTLKDNMRYYQMNGVSGVFAQSGEGTYSEMDELKSYLMAKLLWNPNSDAEAIQKEFLEGYYGKASVPVKKYLDALNANSRKETLSIYGNPTNHHGGYLSPENMDYYSGLMDEAEALVEGSTLFEKRIARLRLSQEYAFLQQARFYGIEPHGIFHETEPGLWKVNDRIPQRIIKFENDAISNQVKELSEGGLTPAAYKNEWEDIINNGVRKNLALNARIFDTRSSFETSFPAKGWRTLVDGNPGYDDFSYNWLCFYDKSMEFSLDLKKNTDVEKISMNFLVDPRHWIFAPRSVRVEVSSDGTNYKEIGVIDYPTEEDNYKVSRADFTFKNLQKEIRYIRVLAQPLTGLPAFRYHKTKKPMIACDEIWVE